MEGPVKGTVTKLSSLFPVEEAQKAAKRVEDTIAKRQKELDLVRDFIADNSDLINLVQKHRNSQRIVDLDQKHRSSEDLQLNSPPKQSKDAQANGDELPNKLAFQQDSCNQFENSKLHSASEDVSPSDQSSALTKSSSAEKASVLPELKKNIQEEPQSKNKLQAFTGSIVEHTHNLKANPMVQITAASKSTTTQRSKPVSRFKMQRR